MKLLRVLAVLIGTTLLVAAIGCSTAPSIETPPTADAITPDIQATIEAGVMATRVAEDVEKAIKATIAVPTQMPTLVPIATPVALSDKVVSENTSAEEVFQQTGSSFIKKIHLESGFDYYITIPFPECPLTEISPKTEEAINELDKIIESEPHDFAVYQLRAGVYAATHRYPQSINDLDKAVELSSPSGDVDLRAELYQARSFVYQCTGELHKAEQDQEKILELQKGDKWVYLRRAYFRGSHGQFELALNDINKFIELDVVDNPLSEEDRRAGWPEIDNDWTDLRGDLLLALGRTVEAIVNYSYAIDFWDKVYESKFKRGLAYLRLQQYEMAIDDFTRAMDNTSPDSLVYGVVRGIAYGMSGQFDEAIADFDKYIGEDQTYAIPYLFRGIALQTLGQSDLAEKDRAKACELDKELC